MSHLSWRTRSAAHAPETSAFLIALATLVFTRSARRVSDSADVPRIGLRPILLLDSAASDTQRTLLVGAALGTHRTLLVIGAVR